MISDGSVSFPVSSFSTSCLNCSLGIARALCNQVAQSKCCPSLLASFANSSPVVQPTSLPSCLRWQVLMDGHEVVSLSPRLRETPFQKFIERFQGLQQTNLVSRPPPVGVHLTR